MESRGGLTDLKVRNLKPDKSKRLEIPDGKQAGLYLVLQPSGKRRFAIRYRINGHPKKLTLKSGLSLADARRTAADAMYEVEKGSDPRETRRKETTKNDTLRSVCERYLKREGDKLRSIAERESALRRLVYPVLGDRHIDTIKRTEISHLLDKLEDRIGSRSADLVLAYLRKIFNWYAINYSDSFCSPIVKGMSRYSSSDNRRTRFLTDLEIRKLWKATDVQRPDAAALRFLLLTGCRKSEGTGLRWEEINGHEWLLPASRHKNKKVDLLRPLSDAALAIVHAQPCIDDSPFVFSTKTGQSPINLDGNAARKFIERIGISDWRIHDLRRTARTLLSRAKIDTDIAEKCLGHLPSGLRQTYDQHRYQQEMAHAFAELAALIKRIVHPPDDVVTPLRRRR
jgi:integrase